MRNRFFGRLCGLVLLGVILTPPAQAAPLSGRYVAMGSSYAAGPGITTPADQPPTRCARSQDNYARQVARRLTLDLVDVSCSGATTANLLEPWRELPAQVAAVTSDTRLVTMTIGGNDLNFVGNLDAASCRATQGAGCPPVQAPAEADYAAVERALHAVVTAVRTRAPQARIVFVQYPAVLPPVGVCARTPMMEDEADRLRATAARLVTITDEVAQAEKVDVVRFSVRSAEHDACAADPWISGYVDASGQKAPVPYPNLAGMTAVADDLRSRGPPSEAPSVAGLRAPHLHLRHLHRFAGDFIIISIA